MPPSVPSLPDSDVVDSPCVNLCRLDERSGLCCGCLRTLDEITAWGSASVARKRAILDEVRRRARIFMNETTSTPEPFYVCAGICRVNPDTNCCIGCGRPWGMPASPVAEPPAGKATSAPAGID